MNWRWREIAYILYKLYQTFYFLITFNNFFFLISGIRVQLYETLNVLKINSQVVKKQNVHSFTYNGPEISVSESKEVMLKYLDKTGSVDLDMDVNKCIAKVCISHPRVKNAINGRVYDK